MCRMYKPSIGVSIGTSRRFSDFYELKEVIGTGGFGSVYGGICKASGQQVGLFKC